MKKRMRAYRFLRSHRAWGVLRSWHRAGYLARFDPGLWA